MSTPQGEPVPGRDDLLAYGKAFVNVQTGEHLVACGSCEHVDRGYDADEVWQRMLAHLRDEHGLDCFVFDPHQAETN